MGSLPVLLKDPRILLIGGGAVALHKAKVLHDNQVSFELLAAEYSDGFTDLDPHPTMHLKRLTPTDLANFPVVVDATGDAEVRDLLLSERNKRHFLLNRVDSPEDCDFYFSALLNHGCLKIAVSTDGSRPAAAQAVRDRIATFIPKEVNNLLEVKAREQVHGPIDRRRIRQEVHDLLAQVDLVGCGPGDVDLLTLEAFDAIRAAEVVLYDHLLTPEILALVPKTTEKIYVGKQKAAHSISQQELNALLLEQALRGLRVARLKCGDPYVFGRGAEEAEFLIRHGLRVRVISGITSAVAGPAAVGIPLTARSHATNFSVVSAHLAGNRLNVDWLPLLQIPRHTTVVMMGLSFAAKIRELALLAGVPPTYPVAIVSRATCAGQQVICGELDHLNELASEAKKPALLVFGDVARLSEVLPHRQCDRSYENKNS